MKKIITLALAVITSLSMATIVYGTNDTETNSDNVVTITSTKTSYITFDWFSVDFDSVDFNEIDWGGLEFTNQSGTPGKYRKANGKYMVLLPNGVWISEDGTYDWPMMTSISNGTYVDPFGEDYIVPDISGSSDITKDEIVLSTLPVDPNIEHEHYKKYSNIPQKPSQYRDDYYLNEATNGYFKIEIIRNYSDNTHIIDIVNFDDDFNVISSKQIDGELPYFVGFYEGTEYFYIVSQDKNYEEDANKEVLRIVKYDKNWNRIDACNISGINNVGMNEYGMDALEVNGMLHIHTSHTMYKSLNDGLNHQANMRVTIDTETMSLISVASSVASNSSGYVSHSFGQAIDVSDDGYILTANRGDGYPRSFIIFKWAENNIVTPNPAQIVTFMDFYGGYGENETNSTISDIKIGKDSIMLVGTSMRDQTNPAPAVVNQDVFVATIPKDNFSSEAVEIKWLSSYSGVKTATTPHFVEINEDEFAVIWNDAETLSTSLNGKNTGDLNVAILDGSGNQVGETFKTRGYASFNEPIVNSEGELVWFTVRISDPTFYTLNLDTMELTTTFSPSYSNQIENLEYLNGASEWAKEEIREANDSWILDNAEHMLIKYDQPITREDFCILIMNAYNSAGGEYITGQSHLFDDAWLMKNGFWDVQDAYYLGVVQGKGDNLFAPFDYITRQEVAVMAQRMVNVFKDATPKSKNPSFNDNNQIASWATDAVTFASENDILKGDNYNNVNPLDNLTYEQAILIALRVFKSL